MTAPIAPKAKKIAQILEKHGDQRVDEFYWLRERENPAVAEYLNAENDYTTSVLKPYDKLKTNLFDEMVARIKPDDESVPYKENGYWYYTRFEQGNEYPVYCRKLETMEADEEVILDVNELAENESFCNVQGISVSPNNRYLSFGHDNKGRNIFNVRILDLETKTYLPDTFKSAWGGSHWANDNKTLYYDVKDAVTLRSYQIKKHVLGTSALDDELIYEEQDEQFSTWCYKSKSQQYIIIGSASTDTTEYQLIDANEVNAQPKMFHSREDKHELAIYHHADSFYIISNKNAQNNQLFKCSVNDFSSENWQLLIEHRIDVLIEDIEVFEQHLVVEERSEGLIQIRVINLADQSEYYIDFGEPAYLAYVSYNPEFNTDILRYGYTSLTTPNSVIDINMNSREKTLLKQTEVLQEGFNPDQYVTKRLYATAKDGVKIPMSVVYKKDIDLNQPNPLLQYAYGSYGHSIDPAFGSHRLSLLDRGFIYVIAHIRGGQEMGRNWYDTGKLMLKKNTFTDFIACSQFLIDEGFTSANQLFAMGGSAGGLLMGSVINYAPELYKGVVAAVPFVDVITTMLDDTIPLTTGEYLEWGNPNEKEAYDYIKSYSPYDNIESKNYPNLLVTTGFHDSQVQYWEPAKWVAKLRDLKTDDNWLLLHTNMDAGHSGSLGRFERYKEIALEYTFLLALVEG